MMFPFLSTAISNLTKKPSTEPFPNPEAMGLPGYRGRIVFDGDKCVDCGMCIKVCSPQSITTEVEETDDEYIITRHFDLTSCTFCAYCQDFCDSKAIILSPDYHMVSERHENLISTGVTHKKKIAGLISCDTAGCIFCGLCMRNCPNHTIKVDRATKTWTVDHSNCIKCGICIKKCPKKVLSFKED